MRAGGEWRGEGQRRMRERSGVIGGEKASENSAGERASFEETLDSLLQREWGGGGGGGQCIYTTIPQYTTCNHIKIVLVITLFHVLFCRSCPSPAQYHA